MLVEFLCPSQESFLDPILYLGHILLKKNIPTQIKWLSFEHNRLFEHVTHKLNANPYKKFNLNLLYVGI